MGVPTIFSTRYTIRLLHCWITYWHRRLFRRFNVQRVYAAFSNSVIWTSTLAAERVHVFGWGSEFGQKLCRRQQKQERQNAFGVLCVYQNRSKHTTSELTLAEWRAAKCVDKGGGKSAVKCSHCLLLFFEGKIFIANASTPRDDAIDVCPMFLSFSRDSFLEWHVRICY